MGPLLVAIYRRRSEKETELSSEAGGKESKGKRAKKDSSLCPIKVVETIDEAARLAYEAVNAKSRSKSGQPASVGIVLDPSYQPPLLGESECLNARFASALAKTAAPGQIVLSYETHREVCSAKLPLFSSKTLGRHVIMDDYPVSEIYQLNHKDKIVQFPPLASMRPILQNLGTRLMSFFGRKQEIQDVVNLLDESRLVTIIGEPGMGKSSLAWRVGQDLADDILGGAWRIVCREKSSTDDLLEELSGSLQKHLDNPTSTLDAIRKAFDGKNALVIIDRCERSEKGAIEAITWLLNECPTVSILATNRALLNVSGESAFRIGPLPYPLDGVVSGLDELMQYDGPRLFVDRIQQFDRTWQPNEQEIKAIISLCQTVKGHPATLVAYAAEAASQSVVKVCEAVVASSIKGEVDLADLAHDPLDEAYRRLSLEARKCAFRLLAVHADCCVNELSRLTQSDPELAQTCLIELSNAGLIDLVFDEEGVARVSLSEAFTRYLRIHITPSERREGEDAHLNKCILDISDLRKDWGKSGHANILRQIDLVYPDVRLALSRAIASQNVEGLRLYGMMADYLFRVRPHQEGIELSRKVCSELVHEPSPDGARAYLILGVLYNLTQEYDQASEPLEQSFRIGEILGDATIQAKARANLMITYRHIGDIEKALFEAQEAVKWSREAGETINLAACLNNLGGVLEDLQHYDEALRIHREVLEISDQLDDKWMWVAAASNIGLTEYHLGNIDNAVTMFELTFHRVVSLKMVEATIAAIEGIALCSAARRNWSDAIQLLATTDSLRSEHQVTRTPDQEGEFDRAFAPYVKTFGSETFEDQRASAVPLSIEEIFAWFLMNKKPDA